MAARSPSLMCRHDTGLLVVDLQEKLVPHIQDYRHLVWNVRRLLEGARALGVRFAATEQYPRGLGRTVPEIAGLLDDFPEKLRFSCTGCPDIFETWSGASIGKVLVVGIEAHVCVSQTVHDLLSAGWRVYVAVDAVGSRFVVDRDTALARMAAAGAVLTTTEAALFEWCEVAGTPEFKTVSRLARESPPGAST